mmetsp:Transcript_25435/g.19176  ORF Transcript_25435/g.19176 Transcript_25435/m.19176 type:complete len:154 (-) Transcript_25435:2437-2898(-)
MSQLDYSLNPASVGGILSNLNEGERDLQIYALKKLKDVVHQFWHEISEHVHLIESLSEEPDFPERNLAASIASKVFYYMEEYEDSLRLALEAGDKFDINEQSQYVETLVHNCIDLYTSKRVQMFDKREEQEVQIDPKMEAVVNRKFDQCFEQS